MPFLDFKCQQCGHTFDELVSVSAMDKVKCPKCSGAVGRVYEGKCAFVSMGGKKEHSGGSCHCGKGSCGGCSGCH